MEFDDPGPDPASPSPAAGTGGDRHARLGHARVRRVRLIIGAAVILAAIVLLVVQGSKKSGGMVYYVTVSELLKQQGSPVPKGLRVAGKVVPGSIERGNIDLRFRMTDGSSAVPVEYRGVVPDTFSEDGEVVVEGKVSPSGVFEATFLMAKCPSKYQGTPSDSTPRHPQGIPRVS